MSLLLNPLLTCSCSLCFSLIICGLYYVFWMHLLPKWRGYQIRMEILDIDENGANTHRLVHVPLAELEQWDAVHDEAGKLRTQGVIVTNDLQESKGI